MKHNSQTCLGLAITPPAVSTPWAKESRPMAASPALCGAFTCEGCALHCSAIFHCSSVLMDLSVPRR